eukprot:2698236-Pleurochrysis_carterae.AAC.1
MRRNAQGAVAPEQKSRPGVTVKKTASSSMHNSCMCARADAAAKTHDVETIVTRRESVRSGVVAW